MTRMDGDRDPGDLVTAPQDSLGGFLRSVPQGQENALQIIKEALPEGGEKTTIALQNRQLQPELPLESKLARSPRRAHTFHTVAATAAYINAYGSVNTVVLADVTARQATIVLNEVNELGFEVLTFTPAPHPLFQRWEKVLDATSALSAFVRFVLFNRAQVIEPEGRQFALLLSQLRISKDVRIYQGMGAESINGLTVTTKVEGTERTERVSLPDQITVLLPLFVNTQPQPITLDLTLDAGGKDDEVCIHVAAPDLLDALCLVFQDMVEELAAACTVAKPEVVGLGSITHKPWSVVI